MRYWPGWPYMYLCGSYKFLKLAHPLLSLDPVQFLLESLCPLLERLQLLFNVSLHQYQAPLPGLPPLLLCPVHHCQVVAMQLLHFRLCHTFSSKTYILKKNSVDLLREFITILLKYLCLYICMDLLVLMA